MPERQASAARRALFRDRGFRRVALGALVSLMGDQFTLVAVPWLILILTGDSFAVSMVIVATNIPRLLFLMIGGALVDRLSAKRILAASQIGNGILIGLLALLALTASVQMWMVYVLAVGIGLATAFSMPSWSAIVVDVAPKEHIAIANSVIATATQFTAIAGPLLAGLTIAGLGKSGATADSGTVSLGYAFLVDFFSFMFAFFALGSVKPRAARQAHGTNHAGNYGTLKAVAEGLHYFWNTRDLRTAFLYGVCISFFVGGPMQVAIPVLAKQWGHGASSLGNALCASGIGNLIGLTIFGIRPNLRLRNIGSTMLAIDLAVGVLNILMGWAADMTLATVVLLLTGALNGYLQIMVYNWAQSRIPPALLGRVMSVFMSIMLGLPMLSTAVAGWVLRSVAPDLVISASGTFLILIVTAGLMMTSMRTITEPSPLLEKEL